MAKKKKEILVIAHDAGGAEVIAAYLKKNIEKFDIHAYVAGPAAKIFRREGIVFRRIKDSDDAVTRVVRKYRRVDFVLLGSGWMTKIEVVALSVAKEESMKTVVYLDSWVNYRERFGYPERGWKKKLPDEIWVGDRKAELLAKQLFSLEIVTIRFVPNEYFRAIKKRAAVFKNKVNNKSGILVISDLRIPNTKGFLREVIVFLSNIKYKHPVVIRLHPAERRDRHNQLISEYKNKLDLSLSSNVDLIKDIVAADVVVGMESMALVVALICRKKVVSMLTDGKNNLKVLPFPEIIRIRNSDDLARQIFDY